MLTLAQAQERTISYNATIKRGLANIDKQIGLVGASVALPPIDLFIVEKIFQVQEVRIKGRLQ